MFLKDFMSLSTEHNTIKRFRESRSIPVRKGKGQKPQMNACDLQSLRWPYTILSLPTQVFSKVIGINQFIKVSIISLITLFIFYIIGYLVFQKQEIK